MRIGEAADVLGKNAAFQGVSPDAWARVEGRFSVLTFKLGETVLAPGAAERSSSARARSVSPAFSASWMSVK